MRSPSALWRRRVLRPRHVRRRRRVRVRARLRRRALRGVQLGASADCSLLRSPGSAWPGVLTCVISRACMCTFVKLQEYAASLPLPLGLLRRPFIACVSSRIALSAYGLCMAGRAVLPRRSRGCARHLLPERPDGRGRRLLRCRRRPGRRRALLQLRVRAVAPGTLLSGQGDANTALT